MKKFYNLGTRSDTNHAAQLQELARAINFLDLEGIGIEVYMLQL